MAEEKPLYQCMTKATTAERDHLRRSFNWVVSRRAILKVMPNALVCRNWVIPYDQIDEAILFSTRQLFIPCYLLRVKSGGTTYQFGLNPGGYWKGELPFPVKREKAKTSYSPFSLIIRILILAYIVYLIWERIA